ncbi:MAG: hypothetical protein GY770_26035 [Aestuariibacter sp.]|nr:hypothetical protein [Aestuariibacter sp.]
MRHLPIVTLLVVYFLCRLLFQQLPWLKSVFIYPTGMIVKAFYGSGKYMGAEWTYFLGNTQFTLGETCSGTTFFSLLFSYLVYKTLSCKTPVTWLLLVYPVVLLVNTMRVLSSIQVHIYLTGTQALAYSDYVHVMTGTTTFLSCFLLIAYFIEKSREGASNER